MSVRVGGCASVYKLQVRAQVYTQVHACTSVYTCARASGLLVVWLFRLAAGAVKRNVD